MENDKTLELLKRAEEEATEQATKLYIRTLLLVLCGSEKTQISYINFCLEISRTVLAERHQEVKGL